MGNSLKISEDKDFVYLAQRILSSIEENNDRLDNNTCLELKEIIRYSEERKLEKHHKNAILQILDGYFEHGKARTALLKSLRKFRERRISDRVQIEISRESRKRLQDLKTKGKVNSLDELIPKLVISKKTLK